MDDNPFRYCGKYYDKETKTIYLRARYYNVEQGRFTQEDPIRDGFIWYAYCENNPIMFVDPTGLTSIFSDIFTKGLLYSTVKYFNIIYNYSKNSQTYTRRDYIYGQKSCPGISNCRFGFQHMNENGCGPIAIYNAMIGLGQPRSLASIVGYAEIHGMHLEGFLGMEAFIMYDYFNMQGFEVGRTRDILDADALLKDYGHAVLLQWVNKDDKTKGMHYVYIQYMEDGSINVYNDYNHDTEPRSYKSIEAYMYEQNWGLSEIVFIRPKES